MFLLICNLIQECSFDMVEVITHTHTAVTYAYCVNSIRKLNSEKVQKLQKTFEFSQYTSIAIASPYILRK